jgi:hypothetical protein
LSGQDCISTGNLEGSSDKQERSFFLFSAIPYASVYLMLYYALFLRFQKERKKIKREEKKENEVNMK